MKAVSSNIGHQKWNFEGIGEVDFFLKSLAVDTTNNIFHHLDNDL